MSSSPSVMAFIAVNTSSSPSLFHSSLSCRFLSNSTRPQSHFVFCEFNLRSSLSSVPRILCPVRALAVMDAKESTLADPPMKLLFVEMGVGYDQHGQDITAAAMRACRDAISSNSIPAFRRGSIPGVTFEQMKLLVKLGVPHSLQQSLDIDRIKSVFPYGKIQNVEVVDGGMICSSGVLVEEMGDKNDDCYIVNAAVYVGY